MRVLQRVDSLYSNSPIRSVSPASGGDSPGSVTRGDSSRYSWPIDADALTAPVSGSSWRPVRSEEHTSELQSLMRNSYAVFCLNKKTTQQEAHTYNYNKITSIDAESKEANRRLTHS